MNILFLTHYYIPEGNAPASRVSALAERWVRMGHQVTVITGFPNIPDGVVYPGYRNQWKQREIIDGVEVVRIWTYIAANKGCFRRICNYISYMWMAVWHGLWLKKPDIMIATSPQFFCGWAGVLLKWIRRIPFVLEIRDIWPESMSAVDVGLPEAVLRLVGVMERAMYRTADHIVTVGQGYVDKLRERRVLPDKIDIVMNGVDKKLFYPRPPNLSLLTQYGLEGKFVCSYVGTIGLACGLQVALDAAEKLMKFGRSDIVFVLIGDGAFRADLQLDAQMRKLDNVVFTGRRPKHEVPEWIASSDVNLVHLKKNELFTTVMPSKIFESAGCARPIIIGVDGYAKAFVLEAEAGISIESENSDDLVMALLRLSDKPELCRTLGRNAYDRIASKYDRDCQAVEYLTILEKVKNKSGTQ